MEDFLYQIFGLVLVIYLLILIYKGSTSWQVDWLCSLFLLWCWRGYLSSWHRIKNKDRQSRFND